MRLNTRFAFVMAKDISPDFRKCERCYKKNAASVAVTGIAYLCVRCAAGIARHLPLAIKASR